MAQAGKTFRIFVSSTDSDLKAERDALQREVFLRCGNFERISAISTTAS
jgi:hypothetical protein